MSQGGSIGSTGGGSGGNVVGPGSSTIGDIAIFNNTSGTLLADSGVSFPIPSIKGGTGITSYIAGDTLYASATNTLSKLPIGIIGAEYITTDSNLPSWKRVSGSTDILFIEDDMTNGIDFNGTPPSGIWVGTLNGGQCIYNATSGHPGNLQLNTQSSTSGQASICIGDINNQSTQFILGDGYYENRWYINIPTLATTVDDYQLFFGLGVAFQSFITPPDNNGVYFTYNRSSSTNWIGTSMSSSSSTVASGGTTTPVTTGWHLCVIQINAAATLCTFLVDGVSIGTTSTHIPTAGLTCGIWIAKTAGTNQRAVELDYFSLYHKLTTPRF